MDRFIRLSDDERRRYFVQTAERMRLSPQIIEKDFWVCWTLRELFALPNIGSMLIFKGGTSLSKAYRLIERFSGKNWGQPLIYEQKDKRFLMRQKNVSPPIGHFCMKAVKFDERFHEYQDCFVSPIPRDNFS
jgi:predicted nucleotidyltransferase component of viral defense system